MTLHRITLLHRLLLLIPTTIPIHTVHCFANRSPNYQPVIIKSRCGRNNHHHHHHHHHPPQEEDDDDDDIQSQMMDHQWNEYSSRFRKFRTGPYHAPHIRRILLLSDLHMDYPANQDWLYNICSTSTSTTTTTSPSHDDNADNGVDVVDIDGENNSTIQSNEIMIIIAGDISHNLEIIQWTFQTLKRKFGEVVYTIGNHELWLDKENTRKLATKLDADDDDDDDRDHHNNRKRCKASGKGDGCTNSIEKLEKVFQLCIEEDVRIGPVNVGRNCSSSSSLSSSSSNFNNNNNNNLWVIPLLSWHHASFDTEPKVECWGGIPSARRVVSDYRRTVWPTALSPLDDSVARFVDGLNDVILDLKGVDFDFDGEEDGDDGGGGRMTLLTFSHFLPRIELIPEKRFLMLPTLHECVGSVFLEERIRRWRKKYSNNNNNNNTKNNSDNHQRDNNNNRNSCRHLHAFGHSHLSWDATIDGVRYVHVPLAYPREWEQRRSSLEIGSMKGEESHHRYPVCIWERSNAPVAVGDDDVGDDEDNDDEGTSKNNTDSDGFVPSTGFPSWWLGGWWSKYYMVMQRLPQRNQFLAPWVAKRYRQLPGGKVERFVHTEVASMLNMTDTENPKL